MAHHRTHLIRLFFLVFILAVTISATADWPSWRGPMQNGVSSETGSDFLLDDSR